MFCGFNCSDSEELYILLWPLIILCHLSVNKMWWLQRQITVRIYANEGIYRVDHIFAFIDSFSYSEENVIWWRKSGVRLYRTRICNGIKLFIKNYHASSFKVITAVSSGVTGCHYLGSRLPVCHIQMKWVEIFGHIERVRMTRDKSQFKSVAPVCKSSFPLKKLWHHSHFYQFPSNRGFIFWNRYFDSSSIPNP